MSIGTNIRYYRKLHNLKQKDLADKLGVTDKAISSWEKDRTEPNMGYVNKMCSIFGCNASNISDSINPIDMGKQDAQFLLLFHQLSSRDKEIIIATMKSMTTKKTD